jgi:hypothetical protein
MKGMTMVNGLVLFLLEKADVSDPGNKAFMRLEMVPDHRIFSQLIDLRGQTLRGGEVTEEKPVITATLIPDGIIFNLLEDGKIMPRATDRRGKPLTFIRAREFLRLRVLAGTEETNKDIIETCKALDGSTPVVLYWI